MASIVPKSRTLPRRGKGRNNILKPLGIGEKVQRPLSSPEKVPSAKNSLIKKSPSMDVATDPEPDIHRRQASVCHVRSKCRCSNILQFTFRRAVSCVLHRPPSQVIHCIVLSFFSSIILLCIEKKIYKKIRKKNIKLKKFDASQKGYETPATERFRISTDRGPSVDGQRTSKAQSPRETSRRKRGRRAPGTRDGTE